ncbi:hypothetical protein [Bradyrhizobium sp. RDI18]|uniref:hypothetical protein n=1 Tax=Bradyrhizobium sp. RDI18 TaxID=3367400 RepID=UPI00370F816E
MFRELVPNAMAPIVLAPTLNVAKAMCLNTILVYLGYGSQPPAANWGNMLNSPDPSDSAPWLANALGVASRLR